MALDGLVIYALTAELQQLAGGKIGKIHQPSNYDIVLQIRNGGRNFRLLLSANPTYPRIHLSKEVFINPPEAPMFCMLLRKHCENGTIAAIKQPGSERIVHFRVLHRDELGDFRAKTIVVELTGRHSNIILLDPDSNTVLDGIRHVTPAISAYRIVMPGSAYTPPPDQGKRDPHRLTRDEVRALLSAKAEADSPARPDLRYWEKTLVESFAGISPLAAREAVHRAATGNSPETGGAEIKREAVADWGTAARREATAASAAQLDADAVSGSFASMVRQVEAGDVHPNKVTSGDGKIHFSVFELTHLDGDRQRFSTLSECLEAVYGEKAARDAVKQRVADLLKLLGNERAKNLGKLDKLQQTIEAAGEADRYRMLGELLTASIHHAKKGDTEIEAVDYYDPAQRKVRIALDPQLAPSENAQRYFKKYNKLKNSVAAVTKQIDITRGEIRYLETVQQQLEHATMADIEEIREELIELGYVKKRSKAESAKRKRDRPAPVCYISGEGVPIYVGKNNAQNEYLTNRLAAPDDTWLHTKDIPGSHVVIRGASFGEATLHEAAMLAAYFSQARQSGRVPVDYTLIRHVRKPAGAKPGFVLYEKQKTLFVTPDEQRINALRRKP